MKLLEQDAQEQGGSSVEALVQGNTEFALALYHKVREAEGNPFFLGRVVNPLFGAA